MGAPIGFGGASVLPGPGTVTQTMLADASVTQAKLSTGGASWDSSGNQAYSGSIKERSRSVAMGEWTTYVPTFAANSGTWTVDNPGDIGTMQYTLIGKTMTISYALLSTTISATPTSLTLTLPAGFTANKLAIGQSWYSNGGGGTQTLGWNTVAAGGTVLTLYKDAVSSAYAAGTNQVFLYGNITFEVQ